MSPYVTTARLISLLVALTAATSRAQERVSRAVTNVDPDTLQKEFFAPLGPGAYFPPVSTPNRIEEGVRPRTMFMKMRSADRPLPDQLWPKSSFFSRTFQQLFPMGPNRDMPITANRNMFATLSKGDAVVKTPNHELFEDPSVPFRSNYHDYNEGFNGNMLAPRRDQYIFEDYEYDRLKDHGSDYSDLPYDDFVDMNMGPSRHSSMGDMFYGSNRPFPYFSNLNGRMFPQAIPPPPPHVSRLFNYPNPPLPPFLFNNNNMEKKISPIMDQSPSFRFQRSYVPPYFWPRPRTEFYPNAPFPTPEAAPLLKSIPQLKPMFEPQTVSMPHPQAVYERFYYPQSIKEILFMNSFPKFSSLQPDPFIPISQPFGSNMDQIRPQPPNPSLPNPLSFGAPLPHLLPPSQGPDLLPGPQLPALALVGSALTAPALPDPQASILPHTGSRPNDQIHFLPVQSMRNSPSPSEAKGFDMNAPQFSRPVDYLLSLVGKSYLAPKRPLSSPLYSQNFNTKPRPIFGLKPAKEMPSSSPSKALASVAENIDLRKSISEPDKNLNKSEKNNNFNVEDVTGFFDDIQDELLEATPRIPVKENSSEVPKSVPVVGVPVGEQDATAPKLSHLASPPATQMETKTTKSDDIENVDVSSNRVERQMNDILQREIDVSSSLTGEVRYLPYRGGYTDTKGFSGSRFRSGLQQ